MVLLLPLDEEVGECGYSKQYGKNYGSAKEGSFQPPARVETGTEVVSSECPSKRCSRALQKDADHEEYREGYLYVRQEGRDFHGFENSREVLHSQINYSIIIIYSQYAKNGLSRGMVLVPISRGA